MEKLIMCPGIYRLGMIPSINFLEVNEGVMEKGGRKKKNGSVWKSMSPNLLS